MSQKEILNLYGDGNIESTLSLFVQKLELNESLFSKMSEIENIIISESYKKIQGKYRPISKSGLHPSSLSKITT